MEIRTCRENITPEKAKTLLGNNPTNRPHRLDHSKYLANEMICGHWRFNGDPIRVCEDGRVMDGQHRLMAVILSGITIDSNITYGLPWEVFKTIDTGRRRSAADVLAINGEKNCKNLSAALCCVDRYLTGRVKHANKYSNSEVAGLLEQHPLVRESIPVGSGLNRLAPQSIVSACHYLFSQKNAPEAARFFSDLQSGSMLAEGDPVFALRTTLIRNSMSKTKMGNVHVFAVIIKAWNYRRQGKRSVVLQFKSHGDIQEKFPEIL